MTSETASGSSETSPEEVTGKASLYLFIERENQVSGKKAVMTHYRVNFIPSDPDIGAPAWRLTKWDGKKYDEHYDVILRLTGAECTCPDFGFRRHNTEKGCKHTASLRAVGLLRENTQQPY